jgi:hypothetical protein
MPGSAPSLDLHRRQRIQRALVAAGNRTNGTVNGDTIDTRGLSRVAFAITPGTITDGTHAPKLQDSPDGTTWTDVAAANQAGAFGNLASNVDQSVAYIGGKRFVRLVVVTSGATTGGIFSGVAVGTKVRVP